MHLLEKPFELCTKTEKKGGATNEQTNSIYTGSDYLSAQEAAGEVRTSITVIRGHETKSWFHKELSSLKRNQ